MHFPRYWKLASSGGVLAWGWSDESIEAAGADGERRVARIHEWLKKNQGSERGSYGYPDRPMREPVLREFHGDDGQIVAVVSRNSYGCRVLNTTEALFVDVDSPPPGLLSGLAGLFGKGNFETELLAKVERWGQSEPAWGWRVYRTKAGIRLLATHEPVAPDAEVTERAFKFFGADRLYRKLCVNQQCFRARLNPKPWRCGREKPTVRWPWRSREEESEFGKWHHDYEAAAAEYATCALIGRFGNPAIHPALRELVDYHDGETRINTDLPLA